ncbi:hypothetical protein ACFX13_009521 [Malus domestica]
MRAERTKKAFVCSYTCTFTWIPVGASEFIIIRHQCSACDDDSEENPTAETKLEVQVQMQINETTLPITFHLNTIICGPCKDRHKFSPLMPSV